MGPDTLWTLGPAIEGRLEIGSQIARTERNPRRSAPAAECYVSLITRPVQRR